MGRKVNQAIIFAVEQYKLWLINPKNLLIIYTIIFINDTITSKMIDISIETGYVLNYAEPLALILSKSINIVIIPIVYLLLMTNYPRIDNMKFFISRMSRSSLIIGEQIYSLMSSATYTLSIIIGTILYSLGNCSFENKWSRYTLELYINYPETYQKNIHFFLPSSTYMQGTPLEVILHSMILTTLYILWLSHIIMIFKRIRRAEIGLIICIALSFCGLATDNGSTKIMWLFPITHTVFGWHYDNFMRKPLFSLEGSYLYFIILIGILTAVNYFMIKKANIT